MIESFGIKDILDIVIVALMLYYLYKIMKESGTINIFYGVLAFVLVWVVAAEILEMKLIGTILDKVMKKEREKNNTVPATSRCLKVLKL